MSRLTLLRCLADCLAQNAGRDAALEHTLQHGQVDWRRIIWLASGHLVTPSLSASLQRRGWLPLLPPAVADYLDAFRQLNRERNALFRQELEAIAAALNQRGLEPLLLKGANALLPDAYPGAEDRMLGDLDLYLPEAQHPEAMEALLELDYQPAHASRQWWLPSEHASIHHAVPMLHRTLPTKVELHRRLLLERHDDAMLAANLEPRPMTLANGGRVLVPDRLSQIRHNVLHARIADHQARERRLNLRQLLEFARLAQRLDPGEAEHLLEGLSPHRQRLFLEVWALAEDWLQLAYSANLPRSPHQQRELWLTELVAASPAWSRGFRLYNALLRLPPRLLRFGPRIVRQPGYLPVKVKSLLERARSNQRQDGLL
jgi:hypothetical protein